MSELSEFEKEILKEINKQNLSEKEAKKVIEGLKKPQISKQQKNKIYFPERSVKFLAFSDTHMGHKAYRPDIMDKMTKDAKRQKVDFAINCGDTLEGMSGREGHIYELTDLGYTQQMKRFGDEFEKFDKVGDNFKVHSIEAQNSHSGWYKNKGNQGVDIGQELEKQNKHYNFLGFDEQKLELENGLEIGLRHPGGGTAYALSYKLQKYINSMSGGQKPHLLFEGHFHKSMYMFYRNIHAFESGTLADQTPFMKKKNTPAHIGYWIVEAKLNRNKNKKVERVNSQFVPFFE